MKANTFVAGLADKIKSAWLGVRQQSSPALMFIFIASFVCLYGAFAIQRRAQPDAKVSNLNKSGITHLQLTDWVAEYFACQNGQCKRVLKKLPNGTYEVAGEKLPLGRGRYIDDSSFSVRPTHVKLSHRINETEGKELSEKWPKEKPVIALTEQPVCAESSCRNEDITVPLNRLTVGDKTWIQFDSHVGKNGHFGPQTFPPLVVGLGHAHKIFAQKDFFQSGIIFELAFTLLAPLFALAITVWVGMPLLYTSFAQFLTARAAWSLFAADTFLAEPVLFPIIGAKNSFALALFFTGWMAASLANFLCALWMNRSIARERFNTIWAVTSVLALAAAYAFPAGSPAAGMYLRAIDSLLVLSGAILTGLVYFALTSADWNARLANTIRMHSKVEMSTRWREQLTGLCCSFSVAALFSFWMMFASRGDGFMFQWGSFILPVSMACVLMYSTPQLTPADVQIQKDFVIQQETLVKLLSQLGTFRHRVQAISLVVNFCNRELPKLGFETPVFSEQKPAPLNDEEAALFEVVVEANVKGPHQSFGWLVARAQKRTETTAMGERIIEALTTALSQHLDSIIRGGLLESEVNSAQKFVPRDLMRLFSINTLGAIDNQQEFNCNGTAVCVFLRTNNRARENEDTADRPLTLELNELFAKGVNDFGGYIVNQEGCRWTILFREQNSSALRWIETTQVAIRNWNQHRQGLGLSTHEIAFGAHTTQLCLRFTDNSGQLRPWITFDTQGIAATLAEVATDYSATTLLSQDYVNSLMKAPSANTLPDGVRPLDRVWNRSKTATVDVFEFFGGDSDLRRAAKQRSADLFSQGIRLYLTGYFDGARSIMSQILESDPHDKAAQRLMGTLSQSEDLRAA
ncbi:MAG: hypothetical protein RLZZ488_49 [Pseudomonadota bacterium]